MPLLVALIALESISTLIFEFLFALHEQKTHAVVAIYSIAIGGEVGFKSLSLWLFGMKYLKSCLEMPKYK
jgi:predicted membrane-bound spermidine synthase